MFRRLLLYTISVKPARIFEPLGQLTGTVIIWGLLQCRRIRTMHLSTFALSFSEISNIHNSNTFYNVIVLKFYNAIYDSCALCDLYIDKTRRTMETDAYWKREFNSEIRFYFITLEISGYLVIIFWRYGKYLLNLTYVRFIYVDICTNIRNNEFCVIGKVFYST